MFSSALRGRMTEMPFVLWLLGVSLRRGEFILLDSLAGAGDTVPLAGGLWLTLGLLVPITS